MLVGILKIALKSWVECVRLVTLGRAGCVILRRWGLVLHTHIRTAVHCCVRGLVLGAALFTEWREI